MYLTTESWLATCVLVKPMRNPLVPFPVLQSFAFYCSNHYEADLAVYRDEEVFIGRDASKWYSKSLWCSCDTDFCSQLVVQDPTVSNKHCRVYSIVVDDNIEPLVYIEDLSSNGTLWNGSFLGRGNEGALLCNGDKIRISPRISYTFESVRTSEPDPLDDIQESEIRVSLIPRAFVGAY